MQALNSELNLSCMYGWKGAGVFPAVCRCSQYSYVATETQQFSSFSRYRAVSPSMQSEEDVFAA